MSLKRAGDADYYRRVVHFVFEKMIGGLPSRMHNILTDGGHKLSEDAYIHKRNVAEQECCHCVEYGKHDEIMKSFELHYVHINELKYRTRSFEFLNLYYNIEK